VTAAFPARADDIAWDAALVHKIAARLDMRRPCMYCGVAFYQHPGELTVVPDEHDPETPAVFGSRDCARRWVDRVPWQPSFRPVSAGEWELSVGVGTYGRPEVARG
jgi:hypothetical protein